VKLLVIDVLGQVPMNSLSSCRTIYRIKAEGKGEFVPVCLTKSHAMKTYEGGKVYLHEFLTSTLERSEWSASRPGPFTLGRRATGALWIGVWAGPRGDLNAVTKRKKHIHCPWRQRTSIVQTQHTHHAN
jgi:hypothetical protein